MSTSRLGISELGGIDRIVDAALSEDLASGNVTARCTVPVDSVARAAILAKQSLVFCGGEIARRVFHAVDSGLEVAPLVDEGAKVEHGRALLSIDGRARSILAAERTALNLLQRACAVATLTAEYVEAVGARVRICDTRKTMPGLRALDRFAVRCGGGHNHRNDLGSGVLIKENHIHAAGGVGQALESAIHGAPHGMRIECEVQTLAEARGALAAGADVLLLDNMGDALLAETVAAIRDERGGAIKLEVSGGITLERLPSLGRLDIDVVSIGALTHSAPAVDLTLLFEPAP